MGGENSKQENQSGTEKIKEKKITEIQDVYILEKIEEMALQPKSKYLYFWIDPKIHGAENQKNQSYMEKFLQFGGGYSSIGGLNFQMNQLNLNQKVNVICAASFDPSDYRALQQDPRILHMFLFCMNREGAQLLMSNFSKIKSAKYEIKQLVTYLKSEQENQEVQTPKTNILFLTEQDINSMNKYRINFYSLTCDHSKKKAKADFISFSKKFYPDQSQKIKEFENCFQIGLSGEQKTKQALSWLEKDNFVFEATQNMIKMTTNPKKLGYLRFPFKEFYESIYDNYHKMPKKKRQIFMVLSLNEDQVAKFKENVNSYLIFSTFTKAYTSEKVANKAFKTSPNSVLIRIIIPSLRDKIEEHLDFGYWINESVDDRINVIFNIYNVFKIIDFEAKAREAIIQYGALAAVAYKRQKNHETQRLTYEEQRLLHNYDYLEDIVKKINSQAIVLQMSGYYKQSVKVYQTKFQNIRKSQLSQQIIDQHAIEMGDIYMMNEDYQEAEQAFKSVKTQKMRYLALVHEAELYLKLGAQDKLSNKIAEIQKNIEKYQTISNQDAFKARNYIGLELMNRGKFREASKLYKNLANDTAIHYDYKYEGIPLVHDIIHNRATCQMKLNNFQQALSLLNSTKDWQKMCEGSTSPGLLITENLIRSLHMSRGNVDDAKQSSLQLQKIKQGSNPIDNAYAAKKNILSSIDQGTFDLLTSAQPPVFNADQSSINIKISKKDSVESQVQNPLKVVNLEQSDINVIM